MPTTSQKPMTVLLASHGETIPATNKGAEPKGASSLAEMNPAVTKANGMRPSGRSNPAVSHKGAGPKGAGSHNGTSHANQPLRAMPVQ